MSLISTVFISVIILFTPTGEVKYATTDQLFVNIHACQGYNEVVSETLNVEKGTFVMPLCIKISDWRSI